MIDLPDTLSDKQKIEVLQEMIHSLERQVEFQRGFIDGLQHFAKQSTAQGPTRKGEER